MMTDQDKKEALREGVYNWLVDHPLSAADGLAMGAEKAVFRWLQENVEDVRERIAQAVVDRIAGQKRP